MVLTDFIYDIVNSDQIWSLVAGFWLPAAGCWSLVNS
jgi:hypothetical protein